MVLRRCRRLLRDEDEAMDLCQDVFVRLLGYGDRLHAQHLSSLLYRIATNLCLNRIRDRRRQPATSDEDLLHRIASADDPVARAEARSLLDRVFGRHPESTRTLAVLHYVDGWTLQEAA